MVRIRNSKKLAVSVRDRVRLHRERKKIREQENEKLNRRLAEILELAESSSDQIEIDHDTDLKEKLRQWANEFRISKRAIDGLLSILISCGVENIPKNHRTLQATPTNIKLIDTAGGKLWHNGLANCLQKIFVSLDRDITISLNFNIDGLPIYNSSKICFYPILASIHGMKFSHFSLIVFL